MDILICKNCGHKKLNIGTDFYDEKCEICGGDLYPKNETPENEKAIIENLVNEDKEEEEKINQKTYTIKDVIDMDLIRSMKDSIKGIGGERTWGAIESICNAKTRVIFRQAFFTAGGVRQ